MSAKSIRKINTRTLVRLSTLIVSTIATILWLSQIVPFLLNVDLTQDEVSLILQFLTVLAVITFIVVSWRLFLAKKILGRISIITHGIIIALFVIVIISLISGGIADANGQFCDEPLRLFSSVPIPCVEAYYKLLVVVYVIFSPFITVTMIGLSIVSITTSMHLLHSKGTKTRK